MAAKEREKADEPSSRQKSRKGGERDLFREVLRRRRKGKGTLQGVTSLLEGGGKRDAGWGGGWELLSRTCLKRRKRKDKGVPAFLQKGEEDCAERGGVMELIGEVLRGGEKILPGGIGGSCLGRRGESDHYSRRRRAAERGDRRALGGDRLPVLRKESGISPQLFRLGKKEKKGLSLLKDARKRVPAAERTSLSHEWGGKREAVYRWGKRETASFFEGRKIGDVLRKGRAGKYAQLPQEERDCRRLLSGERGKKRW